MIRLLLISALLPFFSCTSREKAKEEKASLVEKVFVVNIVNNEQKLKEYLHYHEHVWPEVEAGFRKAGYRKITLYRHGYLLIMTVMIPPNADLQQMGKIAEGYDKRCAEWNRIMSGYQTGAPGTTDSPGTAAARGWGEAHPFYQFDGN